MGASFVRTANDVRNTFTVDEFERFNKTYSVPVTQRTVNTISSFANEVRRVEVPVSGFYIFETGAIAKRFVDGGYVDSYVFGFGTPKRKPQAECCNFCVQITRIDGYKSWRAVIMGDKCCVSFDGKSFFLNWIV